MFHFVFLMADDGRQRGIDIVLHLENEINFEVIIIITTGLTQFMFHNQCFITSNCQLYCQFQLKNLCGQESLGHVRRDHCHHFVSDSYLG